MAPLYLPLSSLLRHTERLQRVNIFRTALRGLHQRPIRRNVGAVAHRAGRLLSHPPGAKHCAASVCSSSSGGLDPTERLWSAYNQSKRQIEGKGRSSAVNTNLSPKYNPLITVSSSLTVFTASQRLIRLQVCLLTKYLTPNVTNLIDLDLIFDFDFLIIVSRIKVNMPSFRKSSSLPVATEMKHTLLKLSGSQHFIQQRHINTILLLK